MHAIVLNMPGQGAKEARCSENIYLDPDLNGLTEYQTVHGSANDIDGKGLLYPSDTAGAAVALLERNAGYKWMEEAMD